MNEAQKSARAIITKQQAELKQKQAEIKRMQARIQENRVKQMMKRSQPGL